MLALLALGCSPWTGVADREALWWGPTERIEAEVGIDLVELPAGEPVGYWPRVVVYADRIELDNRAWFLSLPETAFADRGVDTLSGWLVEPRVVAPIVDGVVPETHRRGSLIPPLYEALLDTYEAGRELGIPHTGALVVVPARGTTGAAIGAVLYSAGQAGFGGAGLAGAVDGRLRMAAAFDAAGCQSWTTLAPGRVGGLLEGSQLRGSTCPTPDSDVPAVTARLAEVCTARLEAVGKTVFERHPDTSPPDPGEWRCLRVDAVIPDGRAIDPVMQAFASLRPLHPDVRPGFLLGGIGVVEDRPCEAREDPAAMDADRVDEVCGIDLAEEMLEAAVRAVERGDGALRWRQRPGSLGGLGEPLPDDLWSR